MFDHISHLLHRQGSCVRFISRCHPDVTAAGEDCSRYTSCGLSSVWLECITSRLATFWPLAERDFLVHEMHQLNPEGDFHVKWLSQLLLSFYPSLEEHFKTQKLAKSQEMGKKKKAVAGVYSARNRPIGDLTQKGRRNSMMQLENQWKSLQQPNKLPVSAAINPHPEMMATSTTATTPTSVLKLRVTKQAEQKKRLEKKKRFAKLDQSRLEGILPYIFPEVKEILKNCAYLLKRNNVTLDVVERELELHFPHGDLVDIPAMKQALKLFCRKYSSTGEVLHVMRFLQVVADEVTQGLLDHQRDSSSSSERGGGRSSVAAKRRYPLWRDLLLVVTHYHDYDCVV
jgi:hypothetical protein